MATETINGLVFQAPRAFGGTLPGNYIYTGIYNMIIGQRIFSDNIKGLYGDLVDQFRTEGSMFGDRILFYDTNGLKSSAWSGDSEAANLLALNRNTQVSCQEVVISQFRKVWLSTDAYLSKRCWSDEGSFLKFNSVMMQWIGDTKRIFETKTMNVHVGTVEGGATNKSLSVTFESGASGKADKEAQNRLNAQAIANALANLFDEMKDATVDYNDYKYLRSYAQDDLFIVYNAKYANEITKVDLPSLFHKDGVEPSYQAKLPQKFFGVTITSTNKDTYADNTPTTGKPLDKDGDYAYTPGTNHANGCVRSKVECDVTVSGTAYHLFPGDEIPVGCKLAASTAAGTLLFGEIYIEDASIICKVMHKESIPYLSAFESSTEFFNPRSLTSNHYLVWGYSELTYRKGLPLITVRKA